MKVVCNKGEECTEPCAHRKPHTLYGVCQIGICGGIKNVKCEPEKVSMICERATPCLLECYHKTPHEALDACEGGCKAYWPATCKPISEWLSGLSVEAVSKRLIRYIRA